MTTALANDGVEAPAGRFDTVWKRHAALLVGVWAVLFLAFFTRMAWLLKQEYWRAVH